MSLATYSALQARLQEWIDDAAIFPQIPTFIALAEAKAQRLLRVRHMVKRSRATIDEQYSSLPDDFLEIVAAVALADPPVELVYVTPNEISKLKATFTAADTPKYFTVIGSTIEVLPVPTSVELELQYYSAIEALSDDNTSNWLLLTYPDIYLYGALLQAAPYMKSASAAVWADMYRAAIDEARKADWRENTSSGLMRPVFKSFG